MEGREKTPLTGELLHKLYWVKGLSTTEMAEKTGWCRGSIYLYMKREGVPIRSLKEANRLRFQREVERARQCIRPEIQELLKKLERNPSIERTKDGRIKLRGQPLEVRKKLKEEALRLKEIGGWDSKPVARALGSVEHTIAYWFYYSSQDARREHNLRWRREHKEEYAEYRKKRRAEADERLIKRFGERCQRCGETVHPYARDYHELEKDPKYRGRSFWNGPLGKLWMRSYGTKREDEAFEEIRKKVMLLDVICHRKVTAEEKRLGRRLTREEILRSIELV